MKIYFTRHGESRANILHEISNRGLRHGLTRKGREQAVALARNLEGEPLTRIYSSPLLRAIETSVIVAAHLGVDYEIADPLREYDCGIIEGRSDEAAWRQWQTLYDAWAKDKQWERRIKEGESFVDIRQRFVPFIDGLIHEYEGLDKRILCVSHGGVYRLMLPLVLCNVDDSFVANGFDHTIIVVAEPQPEGLTCIKWNGWVPSV